MLDYRMVADEAERWSNDPRLGENWRSVARSLAHLSRILIDPYYGCPTEHEAAEVMYRCLSKAVKPLRLTRASRFAPKGPSPRQKSIPITWTLV